MKGRAQPSDHFLDPLSRSLSCQTIPCAHNSPGGVFPSWGVQCEAKVVQQLSAHHRTAGPEQSR